MGVRLGVTGTRDGFSEEQRRRAVTWLGTCDEIEEFHYGDCTGVDEQMLWLVLEQHQPRLHIYPGIVSDQWRAKTVEKLGDYPKGYVLYKPAPPKVRNGFIAEACDELWGFPGSGGGTWDCIRKARKLGRYGFIVYRDGKVEML